MKSKFLLCIAFVFGGRLLNGFNVARADENVTNANPISVSAGQIYRNANHGFQLSVPQGWTATETNFTVFHYNDVFLTVNSRRPHLAIRKQRTEPGEYEFNPKIILQQMQPGAAYISIGYFDGPGGPMMQKDSVDEDLQALLSTNSIPPPSNAGLAELHLRFFKRGHWWNISAYLRQPISEENRQKVMAILKSFRFMDSPVSNVAWAESQAWRELPEKIRTPEKWPQWPVVDYAGQRPQYGPRSLVVKKINSGYSVEFTVHRVGTWEYLVSTNGKAILSKSERFTR